MLTMKKTFDQEVYESTATEIIEDMAQSLMEEVPASSTYSSVAGIDKAVEDIEFSDNIRKLYKRFHTRKTSGMEISRIIRREMEIMKIGSSNMSINQAVDIAVDLVGSSEDKFYGMLLSANSNNTKTRNNITFNPLHPIIASELKDENSSVDMDEKIWTINIFVWRDSFNRIQLNPYLYSDENYVPDIVNILATLKNKSKYVNKNSNIKAAISDNKFIINYTQDRYDKLTGKIIPDEKNNKSNWIVPAQILNNSGVAYPYYGSVYTKNGIAWNITPMMSANINKPLEGIYSFENGGRICTKSGDSKTIKGVSALNHSNLTSPLNSHCFGEGSMTYAYQAMIASLEIITGKNMVDTPKEKPMTLKEFIEENPNLKSKDYLIYMREFVTNASVSEKDTEEQVEEEQPTEENNTEDQTIAPWTSENRYSYGDMVTRRGWVYRMITLNAITNEEPTMTAYDWRRVRRMDTTNEDTQPAETEQEVQNQTLTA